MLLVSRSHTPHCCEFHIEKPVSGSQKSRSKLIDLTRTSHGDNFDIVSSVVMLRGKEARGAKCPSPQLSVAPATDPNSTVYCDDRTD